MRKRKLIYLALALAISSCASTKFNDAKGDVPYVVKSIRMNNNYKPGNGRGLYIIRAMNKVTYKEYNIETNTSYQPKDIILRRDLYK